MSNMSGVARLSTWSTPRISSPFQSGTPMVLRMLAPRSDSELNASLGASAASTAARSRTTLRNTLRVTAHGGLRRARRGRRRRERG